MNLGVPGATAPGMAGPGASALAAGGPDAALRPEPGEARGWIAAERANLLRAVGFAREAGLDATAWRLAALLRGHLVGNAAWLDLAEVSATGLAAATAGGSVPGAALHHLGVADARRRLGDQEGAIAGYAEAARLAREAGWLECQAVASGHLGLVHFRVGDLDRAFDCFQQDFTLSGEVGWRGAQSVALGNMGNCMRSLGRPGDALDYYERCAAIARETGAERVVAIATFNAGVCARELGDAATARAYVKQAIRLNREFGRLDLCLEGYAELGLVAAEESDVEDARRWHRLAGKLADRIGKAAIDPVIMAEVEVTEAALRIAEDRAEEALPVLASAQHRSREADLAYTRTDVAVWQGRALARLGRHDEARERFESAIAEARSRGFGRLERLAAGGLSTLADHPETIRK